jgi:hypothetical protein
MKAILGAGILLVAGLTSGCLIVPTNYTKEITVVKDAEGNIMRIEETESVQQPGHPGMRVQFEHLRGVQPAFPPRGR